MSDAREELLPCPFCGLDAHLEGEGVRCRGCDAASPLVQWWNRRAAGYTKPSPAAEAGLREALEFYADPFGKCDQVPDFYSELGFGDRAEVALSTRPAGESASGFFAHSANKSAGESAGVAEALDQSRQATHMLLALFDKDGDYSPGLHANVRLAVTYARQMDEVAARAPRPSPVDGGEG